MTPARRTDGDVKKTRPRPRRRLDENELNAAAGRSPQRKRAASRASGARPRRRASEREVDAVRERLRVFSRDRRVTRVIKCRTSCGTEYERLTAGDRWVFFVREANRSAKQWTRADFACQGQGRLAGATTHRFQWLSTKGPFWWREAVLPDYKHHPVQDAEDEDRRVGKNTASNTPTQR